jgi:cytochrome c6
MPANLFRGQDAKDVATYVAKCAGNRNCGVTATKPAPATTTTTSATGGGTATPNGKQIFASAGCGGCHTLKDAGSSGNVGPNLDQLKPSKDRVAKQVTNGGPIMPAFKDKLTVAQIEAVAAYVAKVAGK